MVRSERAKIKDPQALSYYDFFYEDGRPKRMKAIAATLLEQMERRRRVGAAEFEHDVRDLIQTSWRVLLTQRPEIFTGKDFETRFIKTMENYLRGRRRSRAGHSFLDDSPDAIDAQAESAKILRFPSPEKCAADRQAVAHLHAAIRRSAPDLEPLFLAFTRHKTTAREQAVALGLPVERIYELRRKLKRFASQALDWER